MHIYSVSIYIRREINLGGTIQKIEGGSTLVVNESHFFDAKEVKEVSIHTSTNLAVPR